MIQKPQGQRTQRSESIGKKMNWRLKLFNLIPNFLKRIGCQTLRRFGYNPDAWLENFLREHKGD